MNISRFSEFSTTQVFTLKSMDRNADQEFQVMLGDFPYLPPIIPFEASVG